MIKPKKLAEVCHADLLLKCVVRPDGDATDSRTRRLKATAGNSQAGAVPLRCMFFELEVVRIRDDLSVELIYAKHPFIHGRKTLPFGDDDANTGMIRRTDIPTVAVDPFLRKAGLCATLCMSRFHELVTKICRWMVSLYKARLNTNRLSSH